MRKKLTREQEKAIFAQNRNKSNRPTGRKCVDCGKDISGLHHNKTRCPECYDEYRKANVEKANAKFKENNPEYKKEWHKKELYRVGGRGNPYKMPKGQVNVEGKQIKPKKGENWYIDKNGKATDALLIEREGLTMDDIDDNARHRPPDGYVYEQNSKGKMVLVKDDDDDDDESWEEFGANYSK